MRFIPLIIFVISSNLDNLVLGLSYGLKGIHIGVASNLLIGLITLAGTVLSMALGNSLLQVLPVGLAGRLGSLAILLLGLYCMLRYLWSRQGMGPRSDWPQENPEKYDKDQSKSIDPREAMALGVALTVNNMGLGVGAGVMGMGVAATSMGSCLCSVLCLYLGNRVGRGRLCGAAGRYAEPLSALLICLMGLLGLLF